MGAVAVPLRAGCVPVGGLGVGTVGPHTHPGSAAGEAPARGEYAGPSPPMPANGHVGQWITVGPRTRAHLARVLEQSLAPVWVALLETSGVPEGQGFRLVIDGAHLEPEPSGQSPVPAAPKG